jgi:hypothetical protein
MHRDKCIFVNKYQYPTCDGCGVNLSYEEDHEQSAIIHLNFGYFSNLNGSAGTIRLCEKCAERLLTSINIKFPDIKLQKLV